jgi:polyhydroxybutyrate depolymerase
VGDTDETITSGGESRTFRVHIPTGFTGTSPAPVILDFHPLSGTGQQQEGSSGWKAQCDSVGCIAVYPDSSKSKASDNSWNAGYCCQNAEKNQVDDVQFARDIIKWLDANTCVDLKRIYASGGSNGGGMTYRMACEASDVIAAVAPVDFRCVTGTDPLANATSVTAANNTACKCPNLNRPITVVAWDEKGDTSLVPYAGGQTPNFPTDCPPNGSCVGIGFSSAEVNAQTWANFNGCTGSPTTDPNNSLCKIWTSCEGNTTVSLCSTTSGGHLSVYTNSSAKFAATAWDILKTQSLP